MSHRTAATALLLASLPYGLALPQIIPSVSELAPNVTARPLPLVPAVNASSVTVVSTVVDTVVESAVANITDVIEDPAETAASALESSTDTISDALPTDDPSILDPEANILPLILPGVLPVETDLPPVDTADVVPSDPIPYIPVSHKEQTVPISTFNAVVQPLLSVIQTLLDSLPGNFAPPLPGIFVHPLLPAETPDVFVDPILPTETSDAFIDPLLPTETLDNATVATTTGAVDPIPPVADSVATDLPVAKRQESTQLSTSSILDLIGPILQAINALIAQIPVVGPAVTGVVSDIGDAAPTDLPVNVPELPLPSLPAGVPELPVDPTASALPTGAFGAGFPIQALPDVPLVLPTDAAPIPVLPVPASALAAVPADEAVASIPAVPTVPAVPTLQGIVPSGIVASAIPVNNAASVVPTLQGIVPKVPVAVPKLPFQVPGVPRPLGKRQLSATTAAADPINGVALSLIKPLLSLVSALLAELPVVGDKVPDLGAALPNVSNLVPAASGLPDVGGVASTVTGPVSAAPGTGEVASTVIPKVPLAFDSSLTRTSLPATGALDTTQIVDLVKIISSLITGLLETVAPAVAPAVSNVAPSLPVSVPVKRQDLGIDSASVPAVVDPLQDAVKPEAILDIIQPLLRIIGQLIDNLPLSRLQQGGLVNNLGELGKRQLGSAAGVVSLPAQQILDLLPSLVNLLQGLIAAVPEPVSTPASGVTGAVAGGAGGLTNAVPVDVPLIRRAVEDFQQGPASDWESFLGKLDESKQGELHRLVHDSAKAVNNDELESLASTLKADFEDLSKATKARLLSAGPMLANMEKRSMRYGKRQSPIPGVQSIGPNLDDAPKTDLSTILGTAGTLDPFNQLNQDGTGHVEDDLPDDYLLSSQDVSRYNKLASSSIHKVSPGLSAILGPAGTLDPNNMLSPESSSPETGSPVDGDVLQDPYAGVRPSSLNAALQSGSDQTVEGLDATVQAAEANHLSDKTPNLPFVPTLQGGTAPAPQPQAHAKQ